MKLLSNQALQHSSTVANCTMNRERSLTGSNGYTKELGLNPFDTIWQLVVQQGTAAWLDLCCGTGRALLEAIELGSKKGFAGEICIVGIDLAGHWATSDRLPAGLQLVPSSLESWQPSRHLAHPQWLADSQPRSEQHSIAEQTQLDPGRSNSATHGRLRVRLAQEATLTAWHATGDTPRQIPRSQRSSWPELHGTSGGRLAL